MEDIIETLLGREIMDETDTVKDMQVLAKNKNEPIAKCDQMSPKLFNITLVQWSFIYGLVSLIILTILLVKFNKREE